MTDLKDEVKNATRDFIQTLSIEAPDEVSRESIPSSDPYTIPPHDTDQIKKPSNVLTPLGQHYDGEFEEAAKKIHELSDIEAAVDVDEDGEHVLTGSDMVSNYETELVTFAGVVLDYTGKVSFSEADFEAAYKNEFEINYTDMDEYLVIIPLSGLKLDSSINLSSDIDLETEFYGPFDIDNIKISKLTEKDVTGILTHNSEYSEIKTENLFTDFDQPETKLEFIIKRWPDCGKYLKQKGIEDSSVVSAHEAAVSYIDHLFMKEKEDISSLLINKLQSALRLKDPKHDTEFGSVYFSAPGWLSHRSIGTNIVTSISVTDNRDAPERQFDNQDCSEFEDFWTDYSDYITKSGTYSKPISRFNEMYRKDRSEDKLIDCLSALEGTLLQGTSNSSYTFRLGLRASILLEKHISRDREYLYEFFTELYRTRGYILHENKNLDGIFDNSEVEINGQIIPIEEFVQEARKYLATLLVEYMSQHRNFEKSIQDVNTDVDLSARAANYSRGSDPN